MVAEIKHYSHVNMKGNQLLNATFEKIPADPSGAGLWEGRYWYNTTDKVYKGYDGTSIKVLSKTDAADVIGLATWIANNISINNLKAQLADYAANGFKITNLADPTQAQDAATKFYVDAVAQGLLIKDAVKVATKVNVPVLSGEITIQGVNLTTGDRVLLLGQTDPKQNLIYRVNAGGAWTIAEDFDNNPGNEVRGGVYTYVQNGDLKGTGWSVTNQGNVVLGTDDVSWTQFNGAGTYSGGACVFINGTTIDVLYDDVTIGKTADNKLEVKDASLGTSKLIDKAVTTAKLDDNAVTVDKLGAVTGNGLQRNVTTKVIEIDDTIVATLTGVQTLTNKTLTKPKVDEIDDINGKTAIKVIAVANAVNFATVTGGAAGQAVTIAADGADTNVDLILKAKGTGKVILDGASVVTENSVNTLTNKTLDFDPTKPDKNIALNIPESALLAVPTAAGYRIVRDKDGNIISEKYKYEGSIVGDGTKNEWEFVHGLGTRSVRIEIFSNTGDYDTIDVYRYRPTIDTVKVNFTAIPEVGEDFVVMISKL